jgi:hypothetical protein
MKLKLKDKMQYKFEEFYFKTTLQILYTCLIEFILNDLLSI